MKNKIILMLSLVLFVIVGMFSIKKVRADSAIKVTVNGNLIQFDQEPIIKDNRVFVPIRAVAEALGGRISYFGPSDKVDDAEIVINLYDLKKHCYIFIKTSRINMWDNSTKDYIKEYSKPLEQQPIVVNGRTLIGVRNLAEVLYANVDWNENTKTVVITSKPIEDIFVPEPVIETKAITEPKKDDEITEEQQEIEYRKKQEEYELEMINLVNSKRREYGISEVKINKDLMNIARFKVEEMKDLNYVSHTSPNYGAHTEFAKNLGVNLKYVGENLLCGYTYNDSPSSDIEFWIKSEPHKKLILNPDLTDIGIGYAYKKEPDIPHNFTYWSLFMGY